MGDVMYQQILHATDLNANHFEMCKKALDIARCFHAKLFLLHVIEPPPSLQIAQGLGFAEFDRPLTEDAEAVMRVLGEALKIPVDQQFVEVGSIKTHVLLKAEELSCGLIIIGNHMHTRLPEFLDSSAHHLQNQTKYDLLTLTAVGS